MVEEAAKAGERESKLRLELEEFRLWEASLVLASPVKTISSKNISLPSSSSFTFSIAADYILPL